ncbi:hypothetical protein MK805_02580 [Shimazuella sp. AN120528]|nr:hypothetical protein [Shimazuella soli]MCH5583853.1 hypothetical protein [Shimazuella soli]
MKVIELFINGKKVIIELQEDSGIDEEFLNITKGVFQRYEKALKALRDR